MRDLFSFILSFIALLYRAVIAVTLNPPPQSRSTAGPFEPKTLTSATDYTPIRFSLYLTYKVLNSSRLKKNFGLCIGWGCNRMDLSHRMDPSYTFPNNQTYHRLRWVILGTTWIFQAAGNSRCILGRNAAVGVNLSLEAVTPQIDSAQSMRIDKMKIWNLRHPQTASVCQ